MKLFNTSVRTLFLISMLSLGLILSSCDNPAGTDGEEHHHDHDPYGLQLQMNGEVIFSYFDGRTEGHQHLKAGAESDPITVLFLDESGNPIPGVSLGDNYSLGWKIENKDVLAVYQHTDEGKWTVYFKGLSEGESAVQFILMHGTGSSAHAHFKTPAINQKNTIEMHIDPANGTDEGNHNH